MALTNYLTETRDLLRDSNGLFFTDAQIKRYVNSARTQIAKVTACLQILVTGQSPFGSTAQAGSAIPGAMAPGMLPGNLDDAENSSGAESTSSNSFQTIPGVELYPFKFANPYVRDANAGVKGILDVQDVAISWGGIRPALSWVPFADLQAYARSYNLGVTSYPFYWSTFGDGENGQVWLFPVPNQALEMEWICSCAPKDLNTDNDVEIIPSNFTDAVKFFAAYLGFLSSFRSGQALIQLNYFEDFLGLDRTSSDRGKTSSYYPSSRF